MIVEFTLSTEENDEALVMEKVLEISKHIKQLEFKMVTTVIQGNIIDSEIGEMESLRLQMAMDRLSKMMTTLSNVLAKAAATTAGIAQNLR